MKELNGTEGEHAEIARQTKAVADQILGAEGGVMVSVWVKSSSQGARMNHMIYVNPSKDYPLDTHATLAQLSLEWNLTFHELLKQYDRPPK